MIRYRLTVKDSDANIKLLELKIVIQIAVGVQLLTYTAATSCN